MLSEEPDEPSFFIMRMIPAREYLTSSRHKARITSIANIRQNFAFIRSKAINTLYTTNPLAEKESHAFIGYHSFNYMIELYVCRRGAAKVEIYSFPLTLAKDMTNYIKSQHLIIGRADTWLLSMTPVIDIFIGYVCKSELERRQLRRC